MLSVEDWAEIRRLHRAEGLPIKAVAEVLGISKKPAAKRTCSREPVHSGAEIALVGA
jgi:hypothetical protein